MEYLISTAVTFTIGLVMNLVGVHVQCAYNGTAYRTQLSQPDTSR